MIQSSGTFSVSYGLWYDKIKHGKAPITLKITVNGQKAEVFFVKGKLNPKNFFFYLVA